MISSRRTPPVWDTSIAFLRAVSGYHTLTHSTRDRLRGAISAACGNGSRARVYCLLGLFAIPNGLAAKGRHGPDVATAACGLGSEH
jgi:hypothetical protein